MCVSAFLPQLSGVQIATFCATLYCHLWPIWLYNSFPHYFINGTKECSEKCYCVHKVYVLIFSTIPSQTFLILRRIERDMIKNVHWYSCKVPVMLVRFEFNLNLLEIFSKNAQI